MIANPDKKLQQLDERVCQLEARVADLENKPNPWETIGTTGHGIEPGMPQHPMDQLKLPDEPPLMDFDKFAEQKPVKKWNKIDDDMDPAEE